MDPAPDLFSFIEIDTAPRAPSVPEPLHDDASDRFAAMEIDTFTPAPALPDAAPVLPDPEIASLANAERARDDRTEGLSDAFLADRARLRAARAARAANANAERSHVATAPVPEGMEGIGDTLAHHARGGVAPADSARVEIVAPVWSPVVSRREIVAGAVAEGHGALFGFSGAGSLARGALLGALANAGLPAEWAPAPKSAHAHAGDSVATLRSSGYDAKATPRGEIAELHGSYAEDITARYTVGAVSHGGAVGEAYGRIVLTVCLMESGDLRTDGDQELAERVRTSYTERCNGEIYKSSEITAWLRGVLCNRLGAVKLGGIWYVRRPQVPASIALCRAVKSLGWGADWTPERGIPVATSDELRGGLAQGLISEASDVLADLGRERAKAKESGRTDIGERMAGTFLGRLRKIAERAVGYAAILGEEHTGNVRERVLAAISEIEPLLGDTSARGALIWEELASEAAKMGGDL